MHTQQTPACLFVMRERLPATLRFCCFCCANKSNPAMQMIMVMVVVMLLLSLPLAAIAQMDRDKGKRRAAAYVAHTHPLCDGAAAAALKHMGACASSTAGQGVMPVAGAVQ